MQPEPALRMQTPAELAAGLRALSKHLRGLDSASPEGELLAEAAFYLEGATDSLREHMREVGRLRTALRVNGLRAGATDAEIDEVINGK